MSNQVSPEVPVYDVLQMLKTEVFKELRVCLPGSISGVDPFDGTVSVKIGVMQKQARVDVQGGVAISYPELTMCPIFTLQGGGVGAVMPVIVGDECLVVFSDRCIDAWFQTGQPMPLPSVRMHDIADGFVLVGLNSLENPLETPLEPLEGGICTLKATGAKVAVNTGTNLITIANDSPKNLFATLTDLNAALTNLTTALSGLSINLTTGLPNPPFPAQVVAVAAEIVLVQTQLAALLY